MKKKGLVLIFLGILIGLGLYFIFKATHTQHLLTLYGNVDIRDVHVGFRVGGRLMELKVDEGDEVRRGQLLARLDSAPYEREVNAAKAAVNQQKATLAYAKTVFAREKRLSGTGASTMDKYQNALAAQDGANASLEKAQADLSQALLRLEDTYLYSPSDGVVLTRAVEPGTMLAANASVLSISLIDPVWVRAYVGEAQLSKAKQGTEVKVYSDSNPDHAYSGVIGFVSPVAEFTPKTVETTELRSELVYRLRIIMKDPKHELRQGMPVTVTIH